MAATAAWTSVRGWRSAESCMCASRYRRSGGRTNVRTPQIREMRGSLGAHERGLVITTSDFSAGARAEALRPDAAPVALMSGQNLVALMVQTELGVNRGAHDVIELEQLVVEEPGAEE